MGPATCWQTRFPLRFPDPPELKREPRSDVAPMTGLQSRLRRPVPGGAGGTAGGGRRRRPL